MSEDVLEIVQSNDDADNLSLEFFPTQTLVTDNKSFRKAQIGQQARMQFGISVQQTGSSTTNIRHAWGPSTSAIHVPVRDLGIPSGDMNAVAHLANILSELQRTGALVGFMLGETRGQTIYASGHVPEEDLDAYLLVYSRVRLGMEGQGYEVDLHLDSDAVDS